MKTCPYCAEEIKDAALVCRYCGRELPVIGQNKTTTTKTSSLVTKNQAPSAWAQGAKVSLIFTLLGSIAIFTKYKSAPVELAGNILFGLPVTFLVWWLLATGVIALWRKGVGVFFIFFGGTILVIIAFVLLFRETSKVNDSALVSQTQTPIKQPTSTYSPAQILRMTTIAQPTTPPIFTHAPSSSTQSACIPWSEIVPNDEGKRICVSGSVSKIIYYAGRCHIYFGTEADFFVVGCISYLETGDCLEVFGTININNDKVPYIEYEAYNFCN